MRIGREAAEGLAAAHEQGFVHRDIKPANLWLEAPRGRVKILDFGLARLNTEAGNLTQSGAIVGTPAYMAPEQARSQAVDGRTDLFSLGAVLYRLATGRTPFAGADTMSILMSLATDTPAHPRSLNPDLPPALADLIVRLLQKDPAKRPQTAREVAQMLVPAPVVEALPAESGERRAEFDFDRDDATEVEVPMASVPDSPLSASERGARGERSAPIHKRIGSLIAVAAATMLLIGGGLGGYKLFFETKVGTLIVEVDGDADVRFKNGELQIYDADGKLKYTLKPGERDKKMPPGKYTVQVVSADGVKLDTDKFEMSKDGKVVLRVTADAVAVAKKDSKVDLAKDSDRRAAGWVLSIGGTVRIQENGKEGNPKSVSELPRGPFELRIVDLVQNGKVSDAGLAIFKDFKELTHLFLHATQVGDAGLAHLKSCTNLTTLTLQKTKVTAQGIDDFKKALPNCKIEWDGGVIEPRQSPEVERRIANLVLARGGKVTVTTKDTQLEATKAGDLPGGEFVTIAIATSGSTDADMVELTGLLKQSKLSHRQLSLHKVQAGDASLKHLAGISLGHLYLRDSPLTDECLPHLLAIKDLKLLVATECKFTDKGMATIGRMVDLDDLELGALTKLNTLGLTQGGDITDGGLAKLKGLRKLTYLRLHGAKKMTDAGLVHLKDVPELTFLGISDTGISDAAIPQLSRMKKLTGLGLFRTKITPDGVKKLAAAMPQCRIECDGGVIEPKK